MSYPIYQDAEFEPIEEMFKDRGNNAGQLPGKVVHYIPEENADRVLALDARIQKLQKIAPFAMIGATVLISFLAGTLV